MQWCQPLRACAHLEVAARQRETREGWGWAEVLQNRQEAGAVLNESSSRAYPHTSTRKVWEDTHVCTSVCASSHTSKVAMARILVRQYSEHKHTDTRARARACTHTHTHNAWLATVSSLWSHCTCRWPPPPLSISSISSPNTSWPTSRPQPPCSCPGSRRCFFRVPVLSEGPFQKLRQFLVTPDVRTMVTQ